MVGSGVVVGYGLLYGNLIPMTTNMRSIDMLREKLSNPDSVVLFADELLRRATPYRKDVVMDVSRHIHEVYPRLTISEDRKERLLQTVIDDLASMSVQHPRELQPYMERVSLVLLLPKSEERYQELMTLYETLHTLSPARQQIYYLQAKAQLHYGKDVDAMKTLDEAIAINPDVMYSFAFRSYLKSAFGDPTALVDLLFALDREFVPSNYEELSRVAAQLRVPDLAGVIGSHRIIFKIYPQHKINPSDEDLELLAHDYERIGLYSGALAVRAMKSKPEIPKKYPEDSYVPIVEMIARYKKLNSKVPNPLAELLLIMRAPEKVIADALENIQRPDLLRLSEERIRTCAGGKSHYEGFLLCAW